MVEKSSANENKVFVISVSKPSIKLGKVAEVQVLHGKAAGVVYFRPKRRFLLQPILFFPLNEVYWREVKRLHVNWNIKSLIVLTAAKSSQRIFLMAILRDP